MSKIKSLNDIWSIKVHWSESNLINKELGCDDNSDIEKFVEVERLDKLIKEASGMVGQGYDKTMMTVKLITGLIWADEQKFYLTGVKDSLLKLLNS